MLGNRRGGSTGWLVAVAVVLMVAAGTVVGLAQPPAKSKGGRTAAAKAKANAAKKGDPLAGAAPKADAKAATAGSYHFRMKLHAYDETKLTTNYYPGKLETASPVIMLVHERERSSKDFEDPIDELKKQGFAESLQGLGYAVLSFDLRGHGANARRPVADREWSEMVDDLQAAYHFLVDRHNRGELNVSKLGVVALGEGSNLAASWAYLPGGGVSHEGRVTDIAALVLVSPVPKYPAKDGYAFQTLMNALASRIHVLLMAGERDNPSHDAVKAVRANVEKTRQNRVEMFPSSLHGYKLLRLEPRVTSVITKFLEGAIKLKSTDWEPRFNLEPVAYTDIEVVRHTKPAEQAKDKAEAPKEKEKEQEKDKEKEQEKDKKEQEKPKEKEKEDDAPKEKDK